jgi:phospholipid/cholesterol/gamma-HCH transport system ATP-binding protein
MQKRVGLARVLILGPKIILFDEPTTGLDPVSREVTNQKIRNVVKESETGCVVVSHDIQSAIELANSIMLLDEGRVVFEGTPEAFRNSDQGLIRSFCKGMVVLDA